MTGTSPSPHLSSVDRAVGAFIGLAVGDALGMPTQSLSPATITSLYGRITAHVGGATQQPYAPGLPAGTVTDDTEQAILVADLLLKGGGHISPEDFARALLNWEEEVIERGSHDLLGPSTKAALEKVRAGADPTTTGTTGTTNGSAMRVTPVGIAYGTADLKAFAEAVHESCRVTHNTQQGFQGAALIAAAVSHGIDGADTRAAIDAALDTVSRLNAPVHWVEGAEVLARTRWAV
ncbi:MAG: ADP-ribosylglycohydrolase, partial [Actinobacteria bacterium]